MTDGLGAITIIHRADAVGPTFHLLCSLVGDADYDAGGSSGLLAALRTLLGDDSLKILSFQGQSAPSTTAEVEYDPPVFHDALGSVTNDPSTPRNGGTIASGDKVFCRVRATGVESADADMSSITYRFYVVLG